MSDVCDRMERAAARDHDTVVFPVPPLPEVTKMTFPFEEASHTVNTIAMIFCLSTS